MGEAMSLLLDWNLHLGQLQRPLPNVKILKWTRTVFGGNERSRQEKIVGGVRGNEPLTITDEDI